MKRLFTIFFFLFSAAASHAQFAHVDSKVLGIPETETHSTTAIARFIRNNFRTDREKFRAIYTWVTTNIQYDTDSMYSINWNRGRDAKITEALRRRKGVCENYAAIFNDIAVKAGLTSYVVEGYTKQGGRIDKSGHSWCAVKLDDAWLLCDPTWDKDARTSPNYFLSEPASFIASHIPFDPMWQLLDHPITHSEFYRGTAAAKESPYFNFNDSIKKFSRLGELQQLEASASRMNWSGESNELVKNRFRYTNMLIAIIYEEKDWVLYNGAVADFNRATSVYNELVQYRNNRFLPTRPETAIHALTDTIAACISSAGRKITSIGQAIRNEQYDPSELKNRLDRLHQKLKEQRGFLKMYFEAGEAERKKML